MRCFGVKRLVLGGRTCISDLVFGEQNVASLLFREERIRGVGDSGYREGESERARRRGEECGEELACSVLYVHENIGGFSWNECSITSGPLLHLLNVPSLLASACYLPASQSGCVLPLYK